MKNVSDWESWDWTYATRDLKALNQMRERLINIGSRYGLISYTDLVKGITFKMNGVHDGNTFQITPNPHHLPPHPSFPTKIATGDT